MDTAEVQSSDNQSVAHPAGRVGELPVGVVCVGNVSATQWTFMG